MIYISGISIKMELQSNQNVAAAQVCLAHRFMHIRVTAKSWCPYLIVLRLQLNNPVKYGSGSTPVCTHQIAGLIHEMSNVRVGMPHEYVVNCLRGG